MLKPGNILGRYRIISRIGAGGMSDVYRVRGIEGSEELALKVLPPEFGRDETRRRRFYKEIRATEALHHKNIVTIRDVAEADGFSFYTMDLVSGGNLRDRIEKGITPLDALRVMADVSSALVHAHEKGFIHRDIKPGNILFQNDGTALLSDFGIVKVIGRCTVDTRTGMSIGTPHYMSPEQASGKKITHSTDLYSLGIVFYEMLTGAVPFDAEESIAVALKHLKEPPPPLPRHLRRFQTIINKLLAKSVKKRFENGAALHRSIVTLQEKEADRSVQATQLIGNIPPKPFSRVKWAAGGGGLALFVMLTVIFILNRPVSPLQNGSGGPGRKMVNQSIAQNSGHDLSADKSTSLSGDEISVGTRARLQAANDIGDTSQENHKPIAMKVWDESTARVTTKLPAQPPDDLSAPTIPSKFPEASTKVVSKLPPRLVLQSRPAASNVYLDDKFIGKTPLDTEGILPGRYRLRIEKKYFAPVMTEIRLEPGMEMKNNYDLEPGKGTVEVVTTPAKASVWLDGVWQTGLTPLTLTDISAGIHHLRIHKEKYYDVEDEIEIKHNMKLLDEIELKGGNLIEFKGKWLSPDEYASALQDLKELEMVSQDTEVEKRRVESVKQQHDEKGSSEETAKEEHQTVRKQQDIPIVW